MGIFVVVVGIVDTEAGIVVGHSLVVFYFPDRKKFGFVNSLRDGNLLQNSFSC